MLEHPVVEVSVDGKLWRRFHEVTIDGSAVATLARWATTDSGRHIDEAAFGRLLQEQFADITSLCLHESAHVCVIRAPGARLASVGVRFEAMRRAEGLYEVAARGRWVIT